jgi:hypothetical protein
MHAQWTEEIVGGGGSSMMFATEEYTSETTPDLTDWGTGNNNDSYNHKNPAPSFPNVVNNLTDTLINIVNPKATTLQNKITFILDNNITLKGSGDVTPGAYRTLIYVFYNGTLVLRKGAVITGYNGSFSNAAYINPIYVRTNTGYQDPPMRKMTARFVSRAALSQIVRLIVPRTS